MAAQLCRARLALDRGDARGAVELVERVLRQAPAERKLGRLPALEQLVRARVAEGDLEEAGAALEALRETARVVGTEPLRASAELMEGVLAAAGGDHEGARVLLEDAADRFLRSGVPFEAARARIELAATLTALGRTEPAEREALAALDGLAELGAAAEAERARRLLEAPIRGDGLTRREREVLRLVAEGLSNRQIAERLVVSEHTVHRHVANILRKLGLPSRAAAAAHAARSGMLDG
jgi:ATP/maltotriose-dependent transcriptional regulator MalT